MMKKYILGLLFCIPMLSVWAQQNEQRAQELLDFTIAGQGDSIYVRMNENAQKHMTPELFNDVFRGLEKQFGKYQSHGEWKNDTAEGVTIYYSDLQFEKYALRFLTAFDKDGKANTLRFIPVPTPSTTAPVVMNRDKVEERPIEVVYGKFKLPGTLTLPKGVNKIPMVIWVHGSGPGDRDETIGPNKPFRDLAWGLADRGIASIRYDKRTRVYGEGYAPKGEETYDDETVDDVLGAIELAKSIKEVDPEQIYVAGHSLGAMLAPRIAERSGELAGIIMMAGNARPLEDLIPEQITYIQSLSGLTPAAEEQIKEIKRQVANVKKLGTEGYDESIPLLLGASRSYWEFSVAYKQIDVAKKITLPILILQGERDYQVTMQDFSLWRYELSRKRNVFFKSYPKLNHFFLEGSGEPSPFEYNNVSYVPDYVMNDIATWIKDKNSIELK